MSNAVSALNGALYEGAVTVKEVGLRGMITLRGNFASHKLRLVVRDVTGVNIPAKGGCNCLNEHAIAWMSPDELLVMVPYGQVDAGAAKISQVLNTLHFLVADVSDARAVFSIKGKGAREVIAKLAPVDLAPERFKLGQLRRTRLAQVPAAFWMRDEQSFELICFRSVASYVFDLLTNAADEGAEVGYF